MTDRLEQAMNRFQRLADGREKGGHPDIVEAIVGPA